MIRILLVLFLHLVVADEGSAHLGLCGSQKKDNPFDGTSVKFENLDGFNPGWEGHVGCYNAIEHTETEGYSIAWHVKDETSVEFFLQRRGSGWMAIGINTYITGMKDSDFLVVRKENGTAVAEDRYSLSYTVPTLDAVQDVELLGYWEKDGVVNAWVRRRTTTCDDDDSPILNIMDDITDVSSHELGGYAHCLLWALGESDNFSTVFDKHVERGSTRVNFYQDDPAIGASHKIDESSDDTFILEDHYDDIPIWSNQTNTYWCITKEIPEEAWGDNEFIDLIRVDVDYSLFVHHTVNFGCRTNPSVEKRKRGQLDEVENDRIRECVDFPFVDCANAIILNPYVPGSISYPSPNGLGLRFPKDMRFIVVNIHYFNRDRIPSLLDVDSRLKYTFTRNPVPKPVKGFLGGVTYFKFPEIEGGSQEPEKRFPKTEGICNCGENNEEIIPATGEPVYITTILHHMHQMGMEMATYVLRGDKRITLMHTKSFEFLNQPIGYIRFKLLPGDRVATYCRYDVSGEGWKYIGMPKNINYGENAEEEMCFAYVQGINMPHTFRECFNLPPKFYGHQMYEQTPKEHPYLFWNSCQTLKRDTFQITPIDWPANNKTFWETTPNADDLAWKVDDRANCKDYQKPFALKYEEIKGFSAGATRNAMPVTSILILMTAITAL